MGGVVAVLFLVRLCHPELNRHALQTTPVATPENAHVDSVPKPLSKVTDSVIMAAPLPTIHSVPTRFRKSDGSAVKHPIYSVHSYKDCFPDVQDVHYPAARRHGVRPVRNREEAERHKQELVYVGANPYYKMDEAMSRSIPYLVPRASLLLHDIGRRFLDSLAIKGVPLHTIIVTSVLRTEEDVAKLRRINGNASEQSCHRFGTTFDISYNRFHTVSPPDGPERRAVRNDSLKFILSEVLRDIRAEERCYVKYEVKQGCFHITVR